MTCSAREGLCPLLYVLFFCIKVLQGKISSVFSCLTDQWCLSSGFSIEGGTRQLIAAYIGIYSRLLCV